MSNTTPKRLRDYHVANCRVLSDRYNPLSPPLRSPQQRPQGHPAKSKFLAVKIQMVDSELKEIDGESFFMTKRFDRVRGEKVHTQTLHAFAGMNFKLPNTYSYEQIFSILNKVNLDYCYKEQLFRTMVFNIIGRNVDDHTKNFGFNMNEAGEWSFSPAYDLTFSYNENFNRITPHFLSVNGENQDIKLEDILHIATEYNIKNPKRIINEINQNFLEWNAIAEKLNISTNARKFIADKLKTTVYVEK